MIFRHLLLLALGCILFSCEKEYSDEGRRIIPPGSTTTSVVTTAVSAITETTAISGGTVTIVGTATVTARGICWSTASNPTIALSTKSTDGTGSGVFTSTMSALTPNTTYYVRAYMTTGTGTVYGSEYSFTTVAISASASVITTDISAITSTTVVSGGTVSASGTVTVTDRGVCWSTTTGPTTALVTKTSDGSGTGIFTSNLSALTPNTNYYARAYIITSTGTFYGAEKKFTTIAAPVVLTIGGTYGGGIIAYVLQPGDSGYDPAIQHGIITAPETNLQLNWSLQGFGTFVLTNANSTAIGTGQSNTAKIIAVEGTGGNYAARYCDELVLNGYSDWFLPSRDEMGVLYQNRVLIGGLNYTAYTTSTEDGLTAFFFLYTINGNFPSGYKGSTSYVRPVRYF